MPYYSNTPSRPSPTYNPLTVDHAFGNNRYDRIDAEYSSRGNSMRYASQARMPRSASRASRSSYTSIETELPAYSQNAEPPSYASLELSSLSPIPSRNSSTAALIQRPRDVEYGRRHMHDAHCCQCLGYVLSKSGSIAIGTTTGILAPVVLALGILGIVGACLGAGGGGSCDCGNCNGSCNSCRTSSSIDNVVATTSGLGAAIGDAIGGGIAYYALSQMAENASVQEKATYIYLGSILLGGAALGISAGILAASVRSCHK